MANSEDKKQSFLERAKDAHFSEVNNLQMNEGARETAEEILKRVETDRIKLKVNKVWVDKKYDNDNIEEQLKVRNRGQVWSDDLRADVTLVDKESGKEIDREKSLKIADIPKLTDRGTYMMGGTEFMFTNQSRLRPGVYTKRGSDGRVSSFFNVDKTVDFDRGYNANFRLHLDPESKQFTMTYGTKNVPLLSALRAVGVNDEDVKKSWGDEVYSANLKKVGEKDDHQQEKLYHAIMGKAPDGLSGAEMRKVIKERLFATELDPETTKLTLGKEYKQVDGDALIDASKKIMAVNKGDAEEDDRDSIVFKNHYGAADHVKENMLRNADKVVNNLKFKLDRTRQINKSLSSQTLNPFIKNVITSSKLSSPPTQTNLMTILDESSKTTIMGEGGVGSDRAVSDSSRNISNSDIGFLDPSHSPEGSGIGVTLHHTVGTVKIGNDIYGSFKDTKGNKISLRPIESFDKTIAFPDQYDDKMKPKSDKIKAIRKNKIVVVSPKEVDLVYNSHMNLFDMSANSIPFLDSLQGNRALTASKMQSQALTLKDRDKPLFKIVDEKGRSISEALASQIALPKAKAPGEVIEVSDNRIVIKQDDGEKKVYQLYKDFPLNSESFITNEPLVKVGDKVKNGQVLADNNNTRDGQFALGANLNVAVMPYRGYNFEDSTIVSESAARKLTSLHNYDLKTKRTSAGVFSKDKFKAYYPNELNKENYDKLDKEGVIKLGQKVNRGDLVIAHLEKREPTADDLALGRLDKQLKRDMADTGVRWENDHVGIVTGVEKHGNQVVVNVRTEEQLKVADKLSGLHGNKHIVSKIVPDEEMPFNPRTGERIDITMSPIGVSNRINTSQLIEMAAGKIAKKTGKQYEWMNFSDTDNTSKVLEDLNKNGIPDKEELIDPKTNTPFLNKVFTGTAHILKLEHKVDHKLSSRYREGYDSNEQPLSGGHSGSKNLGRMEMAALLARKGTENLKEVFNIKGQKNDDFWRAIETGNTPPPPKDSFAWNKFTSMLQGAGLNVEQKGKVFSLRPMVDKDIEEISAGELKRPFETFRKKDLAPMRSGLFDPSITGGMRGDNYSHFKLPEKTLNPSMVMATASLLDMPQSKIEDIMVGKHFVDEAGEIVPPGTKGAVSGGPAMERLLSKIDVNKEIKQGRKDAESITNPTALNKIHRKLRVLEGLKKQDLKPTDYLIENVLVVPPKYRPVSAMGTDGSVVVSDVNDLYQQMAMTSNIFGDLKKTLKEEIGNKDIENLQMKDVRAALFKDASALAGYSDPTSYLHRLHKRKGFVSLIDAGKDKQTKSGYFQRKVMQRKQDLVGRSTIILNPELGGDELGVPRVMAKKIFQPFMMQKMVSWGYKPLEAAEHIEKDSSVANRALDVTANERLVIANRAPTLHRYNMTAFKPKLVDGKAIQVPSTVIGRNFGGDFDGDSVIGVGLFCVKLSKIANNISFYNDNFGVDFKQDLSYIDAKEWVNQRKASMPTIAKTVLSKGEELVHINLEDFPRIESTKVVKENGNEEYDVPEGIFVVTCDNKTQEIVKVPVTKFSIHKNLDNCIVKLSNRDELFVSCDESLIGMNTDTWELSRYKPSEITGKAIPRVKNVSFETGINSVKAYDSYLKEYVDIKLTRRLGYFLGLMIGDGWISKSRMDQIPLANVDKNIAREFKESFDESFSTNANMCTIKSPHTFDGRECYSEKNTLGNKSFGEFILSCIGSGAANKHLPSFSFSAPEEFRLGLISGLIDTDGTSNFTSENNKHRSKPQYSMAYTTISPRLAMEVVTLFRSVGVMASICEYKKTSGDRKTAYNVFASSVDVKSKDIRLFHTDKKKNFEKFASLDINNSATSARTDLVPVSKDLFSLCRKLGLKSVNNHDEYGSMKNAAESSGAMPRITAKKIIEVVGKDNLPEQWVRIVNDENITWLYAKDVVKNKAKITMYDITAPGPYTFMMANGVIVQDTFQLHVPIGQKALKEAETMMPSGGMFKEGWGSILNAPGMDMTIGAYLASKGDGGKVTKLSYPSLEAAQEAHRNNKIEMSDTITVRGKKSTYIMHEINAILPPSHQKWDAILSQKEAEKWIGEVSRDLGGRIGLSLADKLKTVGNDYSTRYGYTLGLTDTLVEKDLRDKVLKEAEKKSKSGKPEDIINAYSEAKSKLEELVKEKHGDKTMLGIGVKSGGSKGIGNTLAITAMPGILSDAQGNAMAIPVIRSYSEGLDTGSYIVAAHGARSGNIQKSVSSFKPGWLTKDLVNSIYSVNINNENPVDDEGIEYDVEDSKGIARRYLARDVKDSKGRVIAERNTLIDSEVANKFRKAKIKSVFVQSPLTDPTPGDGISSYSYGEDYSGQKHKRGDAIGVISAHTITEPSLNMAMKAFHTGGAFAGKKKAAGTRFDALDRLFRFNQNIPNKAMVSPVDGTVKSIKPSDIGGYNVTVNGADGEEVIYIEAGNEPVVKVGSKVEAGQKLDSGVMSAHDVLKHKGMRETQKFLVKEIYDLNDQGLDKRDIETLVRGITNTTKVINPGTFREFVPGDVAPLTTVEYMNRNRIKTIEVSDAVGARLNKQYGKYPKGTIVNSEIQNDLDKGGHDNVEVELPEITHQPFLTPTGIGAKAGTSEDWVARLAHNRIRDVLQMGGSMGWRTDVSDEQLSHPISKFVTGVFK